MGMNRIGLLAAGCVLLGASLPAHAQFEAQQLQVASGVVHPSLNASGSTNPAGLVSVNQFKLTVSAESPDSGITLSGGLLFGKENGNFAGALGATLPQSGSAGIYAGVGVRIKALKSALGVSLGATPGSVLWYGGGTGMNVGFIFNPASDRDEPGTIRFGLTGFRLLEAARYWGLGGEIILGRAVTFVTDLLAEGAFEQWWVHPALLIGTGKAFFTIGYLWDVQGYAGGTTSGGFSSNRLTFGVSMDLSSSMDWQFYYHQLDTIFTAFSFRI